MTTSKKKIHDYILSIIILFIFIFGPVLNKYGGWFDFIFILSIIICFFNIHKFQRINSTPFLYFYSIIILYLVVSVRILFYPSITFSSWILNFLKPFRILFTLFAGYFITSYLLEKRYNFFDFIIIIFIAILLHSIIIICQFINVDFRDFIYNYTTTGEFRSTFEYDFRMGGLSGGSGGSILSTVQSLGVILVPFLLKFSRSILSRIFIITGAMFIFFSIILTGRSGIYCMILFFPLSIYSVSGFTKTIKYSFSIFLFFIFLIFIINQLIIFFDFSDFYNSFYRTFDSFISLTETGRYENNTLLELKDYILFPDLQTLIIGSNDALLNFEFERNLDSDIGYVRNIFSYGLIGLILYVLPIFQLVLYSIKTINNKFSNKLLLILLLIMIFFHLKESYLYVRMFWSIISIILSFAFINRKLCVE